MKVWIQYYLDDSNDDDINISVYSSFEKAYKECAEEIVEEYCKEYFNEQTLNMTNEEKLAFYNKNGEGDDVFCYQSFKIIIEEMDVK